MSEKGKLPEPAALLRALGAWMIGAVILLCAGTLLANAAGLGEQGLGYLSSAISFFCAVTAGVTAARYSRAPRLLTALVTGTALLIVLLTAGFLAKGQGMDPSPLLSAVSFTYAGVLAGALCFPNPGKRRGRSRRRTRN